MDVGDQPWWSKVVHSSGGVQDHCKEITLRFRPIAPKPANASPEALLPPVSTSLLGSKRGRKRKYLRVPRGTNNNSRRRPVSDKKVLRDLSKREGLKVINPSSDEVVTLKLLPETVDLKQPPLEKPEQESGDKSSKNNYSGGMNGNHECNDVIALDNRVRPESIWGLTKLVDNQIRVRGVESWVTVEYVMNTPYMDLEQASSMASSFSNNYDYCIEQENERVRDLEADTCPGFVTDAGNTVRWVNRAYKRLVAGDRSADVPVSVWLVIKEDELLQRIGSSSKFSCLVKVRYKTASEMGQPRAMVVPCDVWRLEFYGGFAWRLDMVAALTLG